MKNVGQFYLFLILFCHVWMHADTFVIRNNEHQYTTSKTIPTKPFNFLKSTNEIINLLSYERTEVVKKHTKEGTVDTSAPSSALPSSDTLARKKITSTLCKGCADSKQDASYTPTVRMTTNSKEGVEREREESSDDGYDFELCNDTSEECFELQSLFDEVIDAYSGIITDNRDDSPNSQYN